MPQSPELPPRRWRMLAVGLALLVWGGLGFAIFFQFPFVGSRTVLVLWSAHYFIALAGLCILLLGLGLAAWKRRAAFAHAARPSVPKLVYAICGLIIGGLVVAQFPIWPSPSKGWFKSWEGAYRAREDGALYRDFGYLSCPNAIPNLGLIEAGYRGRSGPFCLYEENTAAFQLLIELTVPSKYDARQGYSETVRLKDREAPAVRKPVSNEHDPGQQERDHLWIAGPSMTLRLQCIASQEILKLSFEACRAAQAEYLLTVSNR